MEFKGLKITTADQFALLLQEIEKHPELLKQTPAFGPPRNRDVWETITKKLNAIGPPERSMREWKRVFINLKVNTKKKMAEIDEVGFSENSLSEAEKGLERILKLSEAVKPIGETFGVPPLKLSTPFNINSMSSPPIVYKPEEPSEEGPSPTTDCTTGAKKRKAEDQSNFLFRRQLQHQVKYMDLSKEMMEIMDRQSVCLHKLTNTVERQEELMERQLELLGKQTLAMERQAAALERMSELQ